MATITIEVPDDIADKYNRASREEQKNIEALFRAYFKARHQKNVQDLQKLMTEIGEEATRNGLTPEILESILNEK
ncbi:MAG: hypothetical protein SNJ55_12000 [Chloroherpetonaceae bacterium]